MRQEIEIEFKTLLEKEDFQKLKNRLAFPDPAVRQTNHYFDTADMTLKAHQSALRIREKHDTYTLTLKQPQEQGVLETHETLPQARAQAWFKGGRAITSGVTDILRQMNVKHEDLIYYGSLQTDRYILTKENLEYVLDSSYYLGHQDYELEIEADHYETGLMAFETLLTTYGIDKQPPVNKIERFFQKWRAQAQTD